MQILGVDFTSRPSRRKPITCLCSTLVDRVLRVRAVEEWANFGDFETALQGEGPWIAGLDFPFGQSRRFIETIGWPNSWEDYVAHAAGLGREGFRDALTHYRSSRAQGDKEHRRATDVAAGSISPQKLYGVPVALMFFEGAPRLVAAGVTIPFIRQGCPNRIAVEAYPGVLARSLIGRRSYKNDARSKQTAALSEARRDILARLLVECTARFGFKLDVPLELDIVDDPMGDRLDALLCSVQAAWSWSQRELQYGLPAGFDALEGWIVDPSLLA